MSDTPRTDAINTNKRLFDLVRYMRSALHEGGLITDHEYAWLCSGSPMASSESGDSPSAQRLEDYDDLIKAKEQLERELNAANARITTLQTQPELRKNVPKSINLAGVKFGRFTVIGLSKYKSGTWVVRCACGAYEDRKAKAIRNPENFGDRCTKCRAVAQERRSYEWHKNGVEIDWRTL